MIVGLTGGIGSGKSAVRDLFAGLGIEIICADKIARDIVAPGTACLTAIVEHFGDALLTANGELDRQQLKQRIFTDAQAKAWLEELMHPQIREIMQQRAQQATSAYVILEIPLLFESDPNLLLDRTLVVDCSEETQISRVMKRDKVSADVVKAIMSQQVSRDYRLAHADDVISNEGSKEELAKQVAELHQNYLKLSAAA